MLNAWKDMLIVPEDILFGQEDMLIAQEDMCIGLGNMRARGNKELISVRF